MNCTVNALMERQIALEQEMTCIGIDKYRKQVLEAREGGQESNTLYGRHIMKSAVQPLTLAIKTWMKESGSGKPGRYSIAYKLLKDETPEALAYLTLKIVMDSVARKRTLQNVAVTLGGHIEDEIRLREFESQNKALYKTINERVKSKSHYGYKKNVFVNALNAKDIEHTTWTNTEKFQAGCALIDKLVESTGLVEVIMVNQGRNNRPYYVVPTDMTFEWIKRINDRGELMSSVYYPMICPPKPWTDPFNGGYLSDEGSLRIKLVSCHDRNYLYDLKDVEMPSVYKAINALQETPWEVNKAVLDVANLLWSRDIQVAKLPHREDIPYRKSPAKEGQKKQDMNEDELNEFLTWKTEVTKVREYNVTQRSKRIHVEKTLYIADKFKDDVIYFPHNMDFRGRMYAKPAFLNPQGNDLAKGLLRFHEGKAIETVEAANWLAVSGANLYGYDKVSFSDRVDWVSENIEKIELSALDPLSNLWWTEADKPFQFLAWALEWVQFEREGFGFISHLPVALDGSCNGLQHFAAMLKDEQGGKAVNLVPSEVPQDIYQVVADKAIETLKVDIETQAENSHLAEEWLRFGITRKLAKRPVMIVPYSGTYSACRDYIREHVTETLEGKLDENPFSCDVYLASTYLANFVWTAISQSISSAKCAMSWLRAVARDLAKQGVAIEWITPSGFKVQQAYPEHTTSRIKTRLNGSFSKFNIKNATTKMDKKKQQTGIAPNFVHSMDAAALQLYLCKCVDHGLKSFHMVHDAYGVHAADTELSARLLREVFVDMYSENQLEKFKESVTKFSATEIKEPLPKQGTLDIDSILDSQFFFA